MAEQITNYKCPACTGPLHFVGASGKLECDYCSSQFEVAEIEAMYAGKDESAANAFEAAEAKASAASPEELEWGAEANGMKSYSCPSCGAELICDSTTAATSCPYCGNTTIIPGQFSGGKKPELVIPFKLDKEAAKLALINHYKGKRLLPKTFASGNKIEEIKGVYVPFWLYDGNVDINVAFEGEKDKKYRRGDFNITETKHYDVRRAGNVPFKMIPADASSSMPDAHMDAIEPFNYDELTNFSMAYMAGFLADKYDVSVEECEPRIKERATNTAIDTMRDDVRNYDRVVKKSHNANVNMTKVHYALMPVYMLGTTFEGEKYLFAMNGQTGKLIGDLPIDMKKYYAYLGGITAGLTVILGILFSILQIF